MAYITNTLRDILLNVGTNIIKPKNPLARCVDVGVRKGKRIVKFYYVVGEAKTRREEIITFEELMGKYKVPMDEYMKLEEEHHQRVKKEIAARTSGSVIKITCYGKTEEWKSRKKAMDFYLDCMQNSDGAERDRYVNIYLQLKNGLTVCNDTMDYGY